MPTSSDPAHVAPRVDPSFPATAAVWALAGAGLAGAVRLMVWYWPGSFFESGTSGTWTALAWDFAHGELYRPVLAASGYGGTRYMPLLFMAHGLLIRAHVDPVLAGVLLMQVGVAVAALVLFFALRSAGVSPGGAWAFAGTMWASLVYQKYCTDVRADYLAAALVMASLAGSVGGERRRGSLGLAGAAVLCVIGGLTKLTAIVFAAPIAVSLAVLGRRRAAMGFLLATAAGFAAALVALQVWSQGRFLENMRSAITAGMVTSDLWRRGIPSFLEELVDDPFVGVPFVLACWCAVAAARVRRWSWTHTHLAATALVTTVILASPGTVSNHMVDVQMSAALVVGVAVGRRELSARVVTPIYLALAAIMVVLSWPLPGAPSVMATLRLRGPYQRSAIESIRTQFLAASSLYLSTDPIVPVLIGQRAFVLDSFNLDRFVRDETEVGRDLERRVQGRAFDTVVLRDDGVFPRDMEAGAPGFGQSCAAFWAKGGALVQLLRTGYDIRAVRKPFVILQPREQDLLARNVPH